MVVDLVDSDVVDVTDVVAELTDEFEVGDNMDVEVVVFEDFERCSIATMV